MIDAPVRIYLQVNGSLTDDGEVTWCQDQINDDDVAYVLEGKVKAMQKALEHASTLLDAVRMDCNIGILLTEPQKEVFRFVDEQIKAALLRGE